MLPNIVLNAYLIIIQGCPLATPLAAHDTMITNIHCRYFNISGNNSQYLINPILAQQAIRSSPIDKSRCIKPQLQELYYSKLHKAGCSGPSAMNYLTSLDYEPLQERVDSQCPNATVEGSFKHSFPEFCPVYAYPNEVKACPQVKSSMSNSVGAHFFMLCFLICLSLIVQM